MTHFTVLRHSSIDQRFFNPPLCVVADQGKNVRLLVRSCVVDFAVCCVCCCFSTVGFDLRVQASVPASVPTLVLFFFSYWALIIPAFPVLSCVNCVNFEMSALGPPREILQTLKNNIQMYYYIRVDFSCVFPIS
jgi:hypothetical protein